MWNSANSTITGFAISSVDMGSLHDVYEGLDEEEECHKTEYILQFLWRDVSSDFDVIGPYFNLSNSIEAQHLHSCDSDYVGICQVWFSCARTTL